MHRRTRISAGCSSRDGGARAEHRGSHGSQRGADGRGDRVVRRALKKRAGQARFFAERLGRAGAQQQAP